MSGVAAPEGEPRADSAIDQQASVAQANVAQAADLAGAKRRGAWGLALKLGFLLLGVVVIVVLVRDVGPRRVLEILAGAGIFLPIIMLLEALWIGTDSLAMRSLLAKSGARAPVRPLVEATALGYAALVVLPAGRAGTEVVRAGILAPFAGGARVAACAAYTQASALLANALVSVPCAVAIGLHLGSTHELTLLCLGNGIATATLGTIILLTLRGANLGERLGRWLMSQARRGADFDRALSALPRLPVRAIAWCFVGRLGQVAQYALLVVAVGGALRPSTGLVALGIHLVGAALGDFVPNQAGVHEGAYRLFAGTLGFGDDPAKAVSIALVARLSQVSLAALAFVVTMLVRRVAGPIPVETGAASSAEAQRPQRPSDRT